MVHVGHPFEERKRLVWYLAMEEYIAGNISRLVPATAGGEREAFFLWRVSTTVPLSVSITASAFTAAKAEAAAFTPIWGTL